MCWSKTLRTNSLMNLQFYNGGSETEDYLSRPYHQLRLRIMNEMISHYFRHKGGRFSALDIGCSSGTCTKIITGDEIDVVVGLDISFSAVQKARLHCFHGIVADVSEALPFNSESFDVIAAGEIIEHLIDVDRFLTEIGRCLKRSGLLVLSTPNLARLIDRLRFLFGITPKQTIPMHRYLRYHVTPFTFSSLRETLQRCRFTIVCLRSNYVYLDPTGKTNLQSHWLARQFPSLGGSLIVAARRSD